MKRFLLSLFFCLPAFAFLGTRSVQAESFRPPAVPLVACDPYFSIWSCADHLYDDTTRHWTRTKQSLISLVRVDGTPYRLMGHEPKDVRAMPQLGLQVLPTRTLYEFGAQGVRVRLTFLTATLPDDLEVLSRPVTYLTWEVRSADGKEHAVSVYFSDSAELAVNLPTQRVVWSQEKVGDLLALRFGSEDQPVLQKKGDNLRIDWGYVYSAAPANEAAGLIGTDQDCLQAFVRDGHLPAQESLRMPRAVEDNLPVAAWVLDLGRVGATPATRTLILAYDDEYAINYFGRKLRPYWRRHGASAQDLLAAAARDHDALDRRCRAFDEELLADLRKAGGDKYAQIGALAYRQAFAGNKLAADEDGMPLLFPKENFSNGCIATVDVIYPMDPLFLLVSPTLAKASVATVLNYAASDRWIYPFAPHDLGTYPLALGQVYGSGLKNEGDMMPVEESGNMILLLAAIARIEGNAGFASHYWPQVTRWAEYLESKGFDPEKQLCTDDFAGHLAHNVNLSVKAIEALGAYGYLCELRGDHAAAERYHNLAVNLAARWVKEADDGDHYRLAFDRPGTWSQKYNLVWDRILGLHLFPEEVARKEMAFYLKHQNRYGLPLDSRQTYTKLDWILWTATLADKRADFEALAAPVYAFLNESSSRVPMTDYYWTKDGTQVAFQARPVVGGVFLELLADAGTWKKWAGRGQTMGDNWAVLPKPPRVKEMVPTARVQASTWRYTFQKPGAAWYQAEFNPEGWKEGPGGFGTEGTPGAVVRTTWNSKDIWLRREFTLPEGATPDLRLLVHHDEDAEIYLNGILAVKLPRYTINYQLVEIGQRARAALKPGKNILAVHCHQTGGGQYIDVGIGEVVAEEK
ncbi:MAG: DUF4965 domain-containing protein [Planctomycetes bacterium]|nr:DUF4965 domain-containing protein [Planctomycetota bacterium]